MLSRKFERPRVRAGALLFIAMGLVGTTLVQANCDPVRGVSVATKCVACHAIDNRDNKAGPHLFNIIGRSAASVSGFRYSPVLRRLDLVWTPENLDDFLAAPQKFAKGTSMAFSGLRKPRDRADLICFFQSKIQSTSN